MRRFGEAGTPPPPPPCPSGGPAPASNDFSFGKAKKNKKRGTAKLTVIVPGPGGLELAKTKKVKGDDERAEAEGSVKLTVKSKGKAKRRLNRRGKAKVTAAVTYRGRRPAEHREHQGQAGEEVVGRSNAPRLNRRFSVRLNREPHQSPCIKAYDEPPRRAPGPPGAADCAPREPRGPAEPPALPPLPRIRVGAGGSSHHLKGDRVDRRLDLLHDHLGQLGPLLAVKVVYARGATLSGASWRGESTRAAGCVVCRPRRPPLRTAGPLPRAPGERVGVTGG